MSIAAKQRALHASKRKRVVTERGFSKVPKGGEQPKRVDHENKIILGYKVMSLGEAKGHDQDIDETTLLQIVELGQAAGDRGIKSRFTHPGLSSDGMGNYLGRTKNFRRSGESVIADLHLSPRAFDTPNGNLGQYVLDMAESDPDQFGASVVISLSEEYRVNPDGTRQKDANGTPLNPLIRVHKLHASDIVDEPAANEGFFSVVDDSLPDYPARQAFALMDRLFQDADSSTVKERVDNFVASYLSMKGQPMATEQTEVTPTAPAANAAIDEAQLAAATKKAGDEAATAERNRARDILALCKRAECVDKAEGYIEGNFSVGKVRDDLLETMLATRKPVGDAGGNDAPAEKDPNATFKAEYAADRAIYQRASISEEDYVRSRRIDAGAEPLLTR